MLTTGVLTERRGFLSAPLFTSRLASGAPWDGRDASSTPYSVSLSRSPAPGGGAAGARGPTRAAGRAEAGGRGGPGGPGGPEAAGPRTGAPVCRGTAGGGSASGLG